MQLSVDSRENRNPSIFQEKHALTLALQQFVSTASFSKPSPSKAMAVIFNLYSEIEALEQQGVTRDQIVGQIEPARELAAEKGRLDET